MRKEKEKPEETKIKRDSEHPREENLSPGEKEKGGV
jgi:hypothetical protein